MSEGTEIIESWLSRETSLILGGRKRAVRRSSGGLVLAEPYQLVRYGDPLIMQNEGPTSLKIRVRFRDLKRGPGNLVLKPEYAIHSKTVTLEDLKEPFSFDLGTTIEPQRFMLDFGHGLIPVHVYHYAPDPKGDVEAYFVEIADIERLAHSRLGTRLLVQSYRVARDVLRFAPKDAETRMPLEYLEARENYRKLRRSYARVIPETFKAGPGAVVPAGVAPEDLRHFLPPCGKPGASARKSDAEPLAPEPLGLPIEDEEELKPFGLFER